MGRKNDMTGYRFGRLSVIGQTTKNGRAVWVCRCDCGNEKLASAYDLLAGSVKSCGCLRKEMMAEKMRKHGGRNSRLYNIWNHMKGRCLNPKNEKFYCYGAREISICSEWLDFSVFKKWAEENGYDNSLTIERIDVNGNYEPGNCTFVPLPDQNRNKQKTVWIAVDGKKMCCAVASRKAGVKEGTVNMRRRRGVSGDDVLKPVQNRERPVEQRTTDGVLVKTWPSIKVAAQQNGIHPPAIWKCCNGKLKQTHGFRWNYAAEQKRRG